MADIQWDGVPNPARGPDNGSDNGSVPLRKAVMEELNNARDWGSVVAAKDELRVWGSVCGAFGGNWG